jgi:hypothetical protein
MSSVNKFGRGGGEMSFWNSEVIAVAFASAVALGLWVRARDFVAQEAGSGASRMLLFETASHIICRVR